MSEETLSSRAPCLPMASTINPLSLEGCAGSAGKNRPSRAWWASSQSIAAETVLSASALVSAITLSPPMTPPRSASATAGATTDLCLRRANIASAMRVAAAMSAARSEADCRIVPSRSRPRTLVRRAGSRSIQSRRCCEPAAMEDNASAVFGAASAAESRSSAPCLRAAVSRSLRKFCAVSAHAGGGSACKAAPSGMVVSDV